MVDGGYFMGIPVEEFFRVDHKKAIVIGCGNYDQLREEEGYEGFQDIEESLMDVRVVRAGLRRLGFKKRDIVVLKDPDYVDVKLAMNDLMNFVLRAYKHEEKNTLIFCYYAGHGIMDNNTKIVLNGPKMYPLEKILRGMATSQGSYVVALFDCCREKFEAAATRGTGQNNDDDENDMDAEELYRH